MATPLQYYNSIPPVAKTFAVTCVMVSGAQYLGLISPWTISLSYADVFRRFQVWRLITNFVFLGPYSFGFAFRLLIILRNGVQLERGPFAKRTADYVWMFFFGAFLLLIMAAIPFLRTRFLGGSLVFMIVYIWGREFANARVNIHGLVELKGFYFPWYMLVVDVLLGNPLKPDVMGMAAGHLYYFLTVIYPLAGGRNFCATPYWVHKLVAVWGEGHQINSPVRQKLDESTIFRGRSHRLNGSSGRSTNSSSQAETNAEGNTAAAGGVFQGRSHRLGAN
ncbi:hypothetical protein ACET3Z_000876 [Daucus carota]